MTRRLALLRMLGLLPATRYGSMGQMHRRPDQQTDAPPSAVAPTQAAGVLRARLVLIFGTGPNRGLFVYNGTPAKGTLVAEITPPGVTSDPYGNQIPSSGVLNAGTWDTTGALKQHVGINAGGALFLADATGVTRIFSDPALAAQLIYDGSGPIANHLSSSISSVAVTDSAGNAVLAGITDYFVFGGLVTAINLNLGQISIATAATEAGPYTLAGQFAVQTGGGLSLQTSLAVYGNVLAAVSGVLETWHVVGAGGQPPFVNSFSAGGTAPRFQLEPVGGSRVRLSGAVNTGAVTAANTTIFTLPAGYRPSRQLQFTTPNNVTAFAVGNASIQVTTGGAVQLVPAGTAGKFVLLDGICFELD